MRDNPIPRLVRLDGPIGAAFPLFGVNLTDSAAAFISPPVRSSSASHPTHRRITLEPTTIVDLATSGKPFEHRLSAAIRLPRNENPNWFGRRGELIVGEVGIAHRG